SPVQSNNCADTFSPFQPTNLFVSVGVTSGATDFGNRLSIETKEACNPADIPDQSDKVSTVGSGSSVKVSAVVLSTCVHAALSNRKSTHADSNNFLEFVIRCFFICFGRFTLY